MTGDRVWSVQEGSVPVFISIEKEISLIYIRVVFKVLTIGINSQTVWVDIGCNMRPKHTRTKVSGTYYKRGKQCTTVNCNGIKDSSPVESIL